MKVVYLTDKGIPYEEAEEYFASAAAWASRKCSSFIGYHIQDVSDVSYEFDYITEYRFTDVKDVLLFKIKYESS